MKDIPVADVRSFAILGHSGSGKTALTDAIAFKLGLNDRLGSVDAGSSVSDYTDEEKSRKISIFASPFAGEYKSSAGRRYDLNFVDTPGYMDFYGQVLGAVRAVDAALIVVDAVGGVQVGTRRAWQACATAGLTARGFIVTGLDRENASFDKALAGIQETFGANCLPVSLPAPDGAIVDVLGAREAPAALAGRAAEIKSALTERAAETNDALIEKFLGGEELSPDEISTGLVQAVATGGLCPVFACMPLKGTGIVETLDGLGRLFPSPAGHAFKDVDGKDIAPDPKGPFVGLVWRTVIDTFVGQLSYVRVISGTLTPQTEMLNTSHGTREIAAALVATVGKKQTPVEKAGPGDIVAIPKLKETKTGHTLAAAGSATKLPPLVFPMPVHYVAIAAKSQGDEDKLGTALTRICDQDPTLQVERNAETKQVILKGLGDVHIDVAVKLMKSQSNAAVDTSTPKVPYRETVTTQGEGHYRHKKQTGGRGQFGEVYLRVMPRPEGETEWFHDKVVGGVIPGNFIPAVQKGVHEGLLAGAVAGYPVQNVRVEVYDGSYHDVDSSEIAFKIAGARAFRESMSKAHPVLLEPIMTVRISIPDTFMGAITGDLNHRRGRILGMEMEGSVQTVTAEIPLAELFQYSAQLRSLTGGQGTFEMTPARYDVVPSQIAQKIVAESAKNRTADEEE
ncbi:MAG: elongation factor G [Kiritimatiellae bacterium]|nr:elongation factor G [Kiritimatiellia bacterium]